MNYVLPMAVVAAVSCLAACRSEPNHAAWWQGEQERLELVHRVKLANFRAEQNPPTELEELERLEQAAGQAVELLVNAREQQVALLLEIEALEVTHSRCLRSLLSDHRQRLIGMSFDQLLLPSGREFRQATVIAIEDAGVSIWHENGSARLQYADLNSNQREFFGLEEQLSLVAQQQESKDAAAYNQWLDGQMAMQLKKQSLEVAERSLGHHGQQADPLDVVSASVRPLAQPATRIGTGRRYSSRSYYRSYRPSHHYVYYKPSSSQTACKPSISTPIVRPIGGGCKVPFFKQRRRPFTETTIPSIP